MLPVRPYANIEWGSVIPRTYETISFDNTAAVTLTAATLSTDDVAVFISNEGGTARYTVDGTTPVTAGGNGHILFDTERLTLNYQQAKNLKVIADTGTASKLRVTYFKGKH